MPSTTRGFPYPADGDAADGPAAFQALADAVEAEFNSNLTLGGYLEVITKVAALGTSFALVDLYASSATSGRRRAQLIIDGSGTRLTAVNDAATSTLHTGLSMDHATGNVDFPNDVSVGDDLTVTGDLTVGGVPVKGASTGKSIIATEESRTNTAYGTLTTPDQVAGIVVPTDGQLIIAFRALVKASVSGAGTVAIFLGSDQLKIPSGTGAPTVTSIGVGTETDDYNFIQTTPQVAAGFVGLGNAGNASTVTTGLVAAQRIAVEVAAGTYTVSVQYKATSGSITAKERKLWVKAEGF